MFSDWQYKEATLIQQLENGTVVENQKEGLLYVTLVTKQTEEEKRATVCDAEFDWSTANIFCQNMGYTYGEWGSKPRNHEYISL